MAGKATHMHKNEAFRFNDSSCIFLMHPFSQGYMHTLTRDGVELRDDFRERKGKW